MVSNLYIDLNVSIVQKRGEVCARQRCRFD